MVRQLQRLKGTRDAGLCDDRIGRARTLMDGAVKPGHDENGSESRA
jgi:hypothetical protein